MSRSRRDVYIDLARLCGATVNPARATASVTLAARRSSGVRESVLQEVARRLGDADAGWDNTLDDVDAWDGELGDEVARCANVYVRGVLGVRPLNVAAWATVALVAELRRGTPR